MASLSLRNVYKRYPGGVTAVSDDLESAIEKAYKDVEKVSFDNAFYRKDIGKRALKILKQCEVK